MTRKSWKADMKKLRENVRENVQFVKMFVKMFKWNQAKLIFFLLFKNPGRIWLGRS
jgi:hypothetical protein